MEPEKKEAKARRRKIKKAGLPPGSLVYTGERDAGVRITVFDYTDNEVIEKEIKSIDECLHFKDSRSVTWINLDGVQDISQIQKLGAHFNIHPLVLEDIVHVHQRPKLDAHEEYLFVVLRMLELDTKKDCINSEQISFILTNNCVISFQEIPGDVFDPVRERIRSTKSRLRKAGADYLLYALIDAIVDHYFVVLEKIGEKMEGLENEIIDNPSPAAAHTVHNLKQEMILVRKAVWPQREVVNALERLDTPLMSESTLVYLRDVYDHCVQVIDAVESYRDILSGLLEIYLATVSNKMNEVMKVLTVISTIFMPLTFIVGIYGMNFDHMPELRWDYGYYAILIVMAAVVFGMLAFFRRRRWI